VTRSDAPMLITCRSKVTPMKEKLAVLLVTGMNMSDRAMVIAEKKAMKMKRYQYVLRKVFNRNSPSPTSMTGTGTIDWHNVGVKYHISFFLVPFQWLQEHPSSEWFI
jgi:hypothetical protein